MNRERMEQVNGGSVRWDGEKGAAKWGLTACISPSLSGLSCLFRAANQTNQMNKMNETTATRGEMGPDTVVGAGRGTDSGVGAEGNAAEGKNKMNCYGGGWGSWAPGLCRSPT